MNLKKCMRLSHEFVPKIREAILAEYADDVDARELGMYFGWELRRELGIEIGQLIQKNADKIKKYKKSLS